MLCPVQVNAGVDIGALIVKAMAEAELTHTAMWMDQGYPDPSQWSKALKGQAPLDLWRMRHIRSSKFWQTFLSKFASALIVAWYDELFGPTRMARANLREREERRSA